MKEERIQFRASAHFKDHVDNSAKAIGLSMAKYIRIAIIEKMEREHPDYPDVPASCILSKWRIKETDDGELK